MDDLTELHDTAVYFVRITSIDETCIEVIYPSNVLVEPIIESVLVRYNLENNIITKTVFNNSGDVIDTIDIKTPDYAKRIVVLADIIMKCGQLLINSKLIFKYKDGIKLPQEEVILELLVKPDNRYYELVLFNMFNSLMIGKDSTLLAEANGVLEGYNLLLTVLEMGGI